MLKLLGVVCVAIRGVCAGYAGSMAKLLDQPRMLLAAVRLARPHLDRLKLGFRRAGARSVLTLLLPQCVIGPGDTQKTHERAKRRALNENRHQDHRKSIPG